MSDTTNPFLLAVREAEHAVSAMLHDHIRKHELRAFYPAGSDDPEYCRSVRKYHDDMQHWWGVLTEAGEMIPKMIQMPADRVGGMEPVEWRNDLLGHLWKATRMLGNTGGHYDTLTVDQIRRLGEIADQLRARSEEAGELAYRAMAVEANSHSGLPAPLDDEQWIRVDDAADILGLDKGHVSRIAGGKINQHAGKIRTNEKEGASRRVWRPDVDAFRVELSKDESRAAKAISRLRNSRNSRNTD